MSDEKPQVEEDVEGHFRPDEDEWFGDDTGRNRTMRDRVTKSASDDDDVEGHVFEPKGGRVVEDAADGPETPSHR